MRRHTYTPPVLIPDSFLDSIGCSETLLPQDGSPFIRIRPAHVTPDAIPTDAHLYSRIVISGSSAFVHEERPVSLRIEELIRNAAVSSTPVLGICYGHQLIAKALWGPDAVRIAPYAEFGWHKIDPRSEHNFLTHALAASGLHDPSEASHSGPFRCFLSHRDEVVDDTTNRELHVLASSRHCAVDAFTVANLPIWGAQFHSELPHKEAYELFRLRASQYPERGLDVNDILARAVDRVLLWEAICTSFFQLKGISRAA